MGVEKIMLLQCKAAALANSGESVLVIVPLHLIPGYKNFFEQNIFVEDSKLQLISRTELYKHFDDYKTLAQSSHVFVDELLWSYPDGQNENEIYDFSFMDFLGRYVNKARSIGLSKNRLQALNNIHPTVKAVFMLIATKTRNHRKLDIQFLELLQILFSNRDNLYCVWVVLHLFALVDLTITPQTKHTYYGDDENQMFIEMCKSNSFSISTLTTIMRTCKQVNDLRMQRQEEICSQIYLDAETIFQFICLWKFHY